CSPRARPAPRRASLRGAEPAPTRARTRLGEMFQPSVETMPAEERAALQLERLGALVTRLRSSDNPYWQRKLDGVAGGGGAALARTPTSAAPLHTPCLTR